MNHRRLGALLLGGCLVQAACAVPHGFLARPVTAPAEGTTTISGGTLIPVGAVGGAIGEGSFQAATTKEYVLIPGAAFDYYYEEGYSFGVGVDLFTSATVTGRPDDLSFLAIFVNPRFEAPLDGPDRRLSLTIDLNLGFLRSESGDSRLQAPYFSPTIGLRAYLPTGLGGAVISQQIGTGIITVIMPGSIAYDFPIPIGASSKLHLFPEFRWDPTLVITGNGSGFLALFSGGLSFMFEL